MTVVIVQSRSKDSITGGGYFSDGKYRWYDKDLWTAVGKEVQFTIANLKEIAYIEKMVDDAIRIEAADLQYSIVLTPDGRLADGYHRVAKAIMKGYKILPAKILTKMPVPYCEEPSVR